jgi:hypothetical protein
MFAEFIVDHHGNLHLCCYDWRGLGSPGNIFTAQLEDLIRRWQAIRRAIAGPEMTDGAPQVCLDCSARPPRPMMLRFLPNIAADAETWRGHVDGEPGC